MTPTDRDELDLDADIDADDGPSNADVLRILALALLTGLLCGSLVFGQMDSLSANLMLSGFTFLAGDIFGAVLIAFLFGALDGDKRQA